MEPIYFNNQEEFRHWLEDNHSKEKELLVGYHKISSHKPSMTWSQSVDQALCFGWIDGIRRSIDHERYCIRFTPRKPTSIWSAVNIKKVEELSAKGFMQPAGILAFQKRKDDKSMVYSFESETKKLSDVFERLFKTNEEAWSFFNAQAPSYQKMIIHWICSAKQEATQLKRLEKVIIESNLLKRIF